MRKFLLASHAYFAEGIYSSIKLIMGDQPNVEVLCAYTSEDFDLKKEINKIIGNLDPKDELIVITDLFGGSVNNEFIELMKETNKNIYLISGLNLGLLIQLLSRQFDKLDTEILIEETLKESNEYIRFCNNLLENKKIPDGEF